MIYFIGIPGCLGAHYSYVSYDGLYHTLIDFIGIPGYLGAHYSYVSYDGLYNTLIDFIGIPVDLLCCVKSV